MVKVNLKGVSVDDIEPLARGFYPVRVSACVQKKSKEKNKPYLEWQFTVREGDHKGRKAWTNTSLQPQALFALKRLLLALGSSKEDLDGEIEFEPVDYIDAECVIKIDHREYEGKVQQNVAGVYPADFDYEGADAGDDLSELEDIPFE